MKTSPFRRACCALPVLVLSVACGGSDDGGLFGSSGGGGSPSGGSAGVGVDGGAGVAGAGAAGGVPGTGGTGVGGQAGGAGTPGSGGTPASGGAAGSAGSAGTGGAPGYTLDNVCAKFSTEICKLRQGCCTSQFGYDETTCIKNETADCEEKVKAVNAGSSTFNPQNIDTCLSQAAPMLQACQFHSKALAEYLEVQNSCRSIFDPKKQPGSSCQKDAECAAAPTPHGISGCGDQSGKCYQSSVAQAGQKCDQTVYCAAGTRCANGGGSGGSVCSPVKAGDSCYGGSSGCGFGLYCSGGKCQNAKETGSCYSSYYCQSLSCQSYQCVAPWPVVSERSCGKSG